MKLENADIEKFSQKYDRALFSLEHPLSDPVLEETRQFVVDFNTQPYQKSRSTLQALCPAIEPSLKRNAMLMTMAKTTTDDNHGMLRELQDCAELHQDIRDKVGADFPVAVILIFPTGDGEAMMDLTNPENSGIKSELMRKGIMSGAFFKESPFSSTFDPNLKPLRSPHPAFILRNIQKFDWVFVGGIPEWREIYLETFGNPPEYLRHSHCPWMRFKQLVKTLVTGKSHRKYSDGGRKNFWRLRKLSHN